MAVSIAEGAVITYKMESVVFWFSFPKFIFAITYIHKYIMMYVCRLNPYCSGQHILWGPFQRRSARLWDIESILYRSRVTRHVRTICVAPIVFCRQDSFVITNFGRPRKPPSSSHTFNAHTHTAIYFALRPVDAKWFPLLNRNNHLYKEQSLW